MTIEKRQSTTAVQNLAAEETVHGRGNYCEDVALLLARAFPADRPRAPEESRRGSCSNTPVVDSITP
jgi:hypothetical protein